MKKGISTVLAVCITVIVMLAMVAGVWYVMDKQAEEANQVLENRIQSLEADLNVMREVKGDDSKAELEAIDPKVQSTITGYDVAISYSEDNTLASITNNGEKVGEIRTPNFSYVNILKQTKDAAYLSVEPDGIGGYLSYALSFPLYKLDLSTNKLTKEIDYGSDVSSGERYIAGADRNQEIHSIVLKDVTTGKIKKFPVDKKYNQFGSIRISPNEMKLAYAAAIGDPDNERGDIYIIDIASGKQTKVNSDEVTGHAPIVNYWKDNSILSWN